MNWLYELFGSIIKFIYNGVENYGVALILFTILMKVILLPLSVKQQRSMMSMQKIQPQLSELQRKYAHDKDKLSRETMELYKKNNVSPFGGCLPMIFQLFLLLVMINIVYRPATYIMGVPDVAKDITSQINAAKAHGMNFAFLWWDLGLRPTFSFSPTVKDLLTWVLPLLATAGTYASGIISQKITGNNTANSAAADQTQQMTKSMTTFMPLMTLVFAFTMPTAASLYWFISSITQTLQQIILNKTLKIDVKDEGGLSYHEKRNQKRKKR
ncbi:MAG: YidC/Oxa1 family membrane protein insertase [Clostridia bacterium]|nr:YidC/Oxa1 family membrane protein insertase [Oscillospiraceae bacterium]MBQ7033017.1 YidC/Oxa1 family membrane protein insertase [Clostridia bacterium]